MYSKSLLAGAALMAASNLGAQTPTFSGSFVSMLGTDTVAVEEYTRTGTKLEGRVLTRFPRVLVAHYVADIDAGVFKGMSVSSNPVVADAAAPPISSVMTLVADSQATVEVMRNGRADTASSGRRSFKGRAAPSVPGIPPAFGLYEQILALNPPAGRDTVIVSMLGAGAVSTLSLVRRSRDTVVFISSFNPGWTEVATVDASGRITSMDATATTIKTHTRRTSGPALDFDALARSWAALEETRGRAGRMSPPDTVRATVGTANLEIVYSRPFKRGRDVWGKVVEWGKPWRTGANAATQLTTSANLMFGATTVPAGKYTLWSLPTPTGTKLIINSQTGQWGTIYDSARDLVRLDMTHTTLSTPVEEFTFAIVPQGAAGILKFSWDNREYSIPFRTR